MILKTILKVRGTEPGRIRGRAQRPRSVQIPVLLWRAADDRHQPDPWYEEPVRSALPRPPEYHVELVAGHYAFLLPCSARLRAIAPMACVDAPGFDRAAFHRRLNAALASFFQSRATALEQFQEQCERVSVWNCVKTKS